MHQGEVGVHLLQPRILRFQVLQAFEVAGGETTVFGLPVVKRRVADADFTAEVAHLLSALVALEDGDDLGFAESGRFHGSKIRCFFIFDRANFGEAYR